MKARNYVCIFSVTFPTVANPPPPVSIVGEMCIARFVYVGVCVCLCECENRSLLLSVDALGDARSNGIGNGVGAESFGLIPTSAGSSRDVFLIVPR